tara:strand:+ start:7856 stop:9217 length:1362 start_codon:yes stop_codon:yes gene_type:complete
VTSCSFSDLRQRLALGMPSGHCDETGVRRLWWAALETLQQDLLLQANVRQGLWIAAPLPALYEPQLLDHLQGWVWAPQNLEQLTPSGTALPGTKGNVTLSSTTGHYRRLSLDEADGHDPILVVITPTLQLALALHGPDGHRQLLMRCDPTTLSDALAFIGTRLQSQAPSLVGQLQDDLRELGPLHSDETLPQRFWPRLAERLASMAPSLTVQTATVPSAPSEQEREELDLLEAITHEVRTPLATIRTLIRSLMRRKDLAEIVLQRLQQIDVECSEQIDRFGLIFHAAELQRQPGEMRLARTDLDLILRSLADGWADQLARRGIDLDLDLEPGLPVILSDPRRLEPMLGGLIDRASRGLPNGAQLRLLLRAAGARLKLQILVHGPQHQRSEADETNQDQQTARIGPVLSWNPETGSLQLSQQATRQLLASLGGRYRQRQDRNVTVFFPVANDPD